MIRFRDYTLYRDGVALLANLNAEFDTPGIHAILGPSGCGKSTLLKVITRLIETRPLVRDGQSGWSATGSVEVFGQPVATWDPIVLRRKVGLILQKPWFPPVSIEEAVIGPLVAVQGCSRRSARSKARETLVRV